MLSVSVRSQAFFLFRHLVPSWDLSMLHLFLKNLIIGL